MKLFLLSLISAILLSSCCKSEFKGEQKFSDEEKSVNPYSGFEDIRFVDDTGKIILYTYGKRAVYLTEFPENEGISCSDYFVIEEEDQTKYRCLNPQSILNISIHNNTNPFSNTRNPAVFNISFEVLNSNPSFIQLFGNIPIDSMLSVTENSDLYSKNLILRDKNFENVYHFPGNLFYQNSDKKDTLYYSLTKGILGIRFIGGTLWVKQ